ncbi:MAG: aminotransferase class V-fold PLP-dependent enzyme [Candidatus Tectomicrobia bacterium]|uniref:Aminotransferase class V-fold PLP-dependent enzyme n=1 Tax=Tectimicrobiota bacterium TaxID=2528274 RepID=A0A932HWR5_UNCTE|nr:aminotransferase class V-fold PLP-dependent enzyme [Candidatus Tectomicrobia bacterium]
MKLTPDVIRRMRAQMPALRRQIYVNWGGSGPSPLPVLREVDRVLKREAALGPFHPKVREEGRALFAALRKEVAELMAAGEDEIAFADNTTSGVNLAAAGIEWRLGDEVIVSDLEHPGGYLPWLVWRDRRRVKVRLLPTGASDKELLGRLDSLLRPQTRAVCMSHVAWLTGRRLPLKEIALRCRKVGALLVVDGAQSVGQMPVDAPALGADVYTLSGQKWLMGPQGTGAVFVKKGLQRRIREAAAGYRSAKEKALPTLTYLPHESAARFEVATVSPALFAGLRAAVARCLQAGPAAIEARVASLAGRLLEILRSDEGVEVLSPAGPAQSGLVSFRVRGVKAEEAVNALLGRHKVVLRSVDADPPAIRASIHYLNTEAEAERIGGAVLKLARRRKRKR